MSLPNYFMNKTPEQIEIQKKFMDLTEGMDLPKFRILNGDFHWVWRNAGVKNSQHPRFQELMTFVKAHLLD